MKLLELQSKDIEALKSFNNTVVSRRLYPTEAPQVATALDRGYKSVKLYLRSHGQLECSLRGEKPYLCGQPLKQEIIDSFPNLLVYQQLRLLNLSKLIISSEIDRFAFGQLISVFNASVEKIKQEGGGLNYITSLGLVSYFPDEGLSPLGSAEDTGNTDAIRTRDLVKVRPEIVACLFGKDKRPVIEAELQEKMANTETAIETLAACVAHILRDIQKSKTITASALFPLILEKAEKLIPKINKNEVAQGLARLFVESLREPALCVVVAQDYPDGFGITVYEGLISHLTTEKFAGIVVLLRQQLAKAKRIGGKISLQVQLLEKALLTLLDSPKGKQFISSEKAKLIIHDGEIDRKRRRLEAGIKGLLQGNTSVLKSVELVDFLPDGIRQLQKKVAYSDVNALLHNIVTYYRLGEEPGEAILKSLIAIGQNFIADDHWELLDSILEPIIEEVRKGSVEEELLEKAVTLLQQVMQKSWQAGNYDRGDAILSLFHQIRSGQIPYSSSLKAIVAKVQDRGLLRANLPDLLSQILVSPKDEKLSFRLIFQGPIALRYIVDSLIKTENSYDRLKILDLLSYSSDFLPSVVHERLHEHMPWYGKRNLIKLLGDTGSEEDAESLLPYLRHEDFRVQRETFLALYKLGGENKKRLLLRALEESTESIKVQVIGALTDFCDPEVAGKLVDLLTLNEQFSEENRNDLLLQLLETLGRCPCQIAYKGVDAFLQKKGHRAYKKIQEPIWVAAEKALSFLHNELQETRKKHVQVSQFRKDALKKVAKISKVVIPERVITGLPQEQVVRTLLALGDKTAAVGQVVELIERTARLRNYHQAERLREWLIEIDPMALSHILRAAEIIDREKIAAIDKSHLETWAELYDVLTTDEFSVLYHSLKHKKFKSEEIVINQGAMQGTLFFINSGKVKLYFDAKGGEVLVKTMGRGEIFGGDSFFEASVWTISVAAIGSSEISVLTQQALRKWTEEFPGLESKLQDFCHKTENIDDFIKRSSNDRRVHKRYRVSGNVTTTLLDNRDRSLGTNSMAELFDISEGGLSFLLRISQKENSRLLLGRKMQLTLRLGEGGGESIILTGEILAVKKIYAVDKEYSLHMKFDNVITRKQLHDIVMSMRLQ